MIHSCSLIQDDGLELKKSNEYFIEDDHIISSSCFFIFYTNRSLVSPCKEIVYLERTFFLGSDQAHKQHWQCRSHYFLHRDAILVFIKITKMSDTEHHFS